MSSRWHDGVSYVSEFVNRWALAERCRDCAASMHEPCTGVRTPGTYVARYVVHTTRELAGMRRWLKWRRLQAWLREYGDVLTG